MTGIMAEALNGFVTLFTQPMLLLAIIMGMLVGVFIGSLPGLNIVAGAALVIPFTYTMDPAFALIFVTSMYVGGVFGGSAPAILFNMPGDTPAACTAIDGYPLAQKGSAGKAIGTMIVASAVGGMIGTLSVLFVSPLLAEVALSFGPVEFFALCFLGLSVVGGIGTNSVSKGIISALIGILLASVGTAELSGMVRFTFDQSALLSGFDYIPIMIGAFAVSEVFIKFMDNNKNQTGTGMEVKGQIFKLKEVLALKWITVRSGILGTLIGILPGAGATVASFFSYSVQQRISKRKSEFGHGSVEGLTAAEGANNSAAMGSLVPLLTLGIPGGAVAAVMFGIFQIHQLQPGPLLFMNNQDIVYPLIASAFIANLLILVIGSAQAKQIAKIINIPAPVLYSTIMALTIIGAYSINNRLFDVWVMMAFGIIGYFMKKHGFSVPALVLGLILGPILEESLIRGLLVNDNNILGFFSSPIAAPMLIVGLMIIIYPLIDSVKEQMRAKRNDGISQ